MTRPTLLVQTVYFHDSDRASALDLGQRLYANLTRPLEDPLAPGPGIPVLLGTSPARVDFNAASHVVVVPVLGGKAFQAVETRKLVIKTLNEWQGQVADKHCVLPVFTSKNWRFEELKLPGEPILSQLYEADAATWLQTVINVVLMTSSLLHEGVKPRIFVSHAKVDLKITGEVAKQIAVFIKTQTIGDAFFDTTELNPGQNQQTQLDAGAGGGVFLAVRSDSYGMRPWCEKELLQAKRQKVPTLTVEVLTRGEHRSYPYLGNGPTIVWSSATSSIAAVALRAMIEAVRARHFTLEATRITEGLPAPIVLPRPPELLDLAQGPLREKEEPIVVLHPDPELSAAERAVLREARPRMRLVTPSTFYRGLLRRPEGAGPAREGALAAAGKFASPAAPLSDREIALSLSDSAEAESIEEGFTADHVKDATFFLARSLLSAGASIAYGGNFRNGGFDEFLSELVVAYNESGNQTANYLISYLAPQVKVPPNSAVTTYPVDPDSTYAKAMMPRLPQGALPPARAALYFSDMRRAMAEHCFARVSIGGQSSPKKNGSKPGYGGAYPGVVEEAWRSLDAKTPLYVLGGFGGAARMVADLLSGKPTPAAMLPETWSGARYSEFRERALAFSTDRYRTKLRAPAGLTEMVKALRKASAHLASDESSLKWNGLSKQENLELFVTRDPVTIARLIMRGLFKKSMEGPPGALRVTLVRGSITQVENADALAVAVFDNVPPGGAGAALDRLLSSRLTTAIKAKEEIVAMPTPEVDADWLMIADLGEFRGDLNGLPGIIEQRAREIAQRSRRYGFRELGLVTFGGNVHPDLDKIVTRMVKGLSSVKDAPSIQWFELDEGRFERLKKILKRPGVTLSVRKLVTVAEVRPAAADRDVIVTVRYEGETLYTTILPPKGSAAAWEGKTALSLQQFDALAPQESTTPAKAELARIGNTLAKALFDAEGRRRMLANKEYRLVVQHDAKSSALPFESLAIEGHRFSLNKGLVRRPTLPNLRRVDLPDQPGHGDGLNILLVANPTLDLPGTEEEAAAVKAQLLGQKDKAKITKELIGAAATKSALLEALQDAEVDVLHYSGHAFYDGPGDEESGLECHDGKLTLKDLKGRVPRMVFFNACQSARLRKKEKELAVLSRSFAEYFLRGGVEAYLGTFWLVKDGAAAAFATTVYEKLAEGAALDAAVREARSRLESGPAADSDWANYVLYGDGGFRLISPTK